jgi:hypothetical protein
MPPHSRTFLSVDLLVMTTSSIRIEASVDERRARSIGKSTDPLCGFPTSADGQARGLADREHADGRISVGLALRVARPS